MNTAIDKGVTRGLIICAIVLLPLLAGCATVRPLPLTEGMSDIRLEKESLVICTIQMANQYKFDYQPEVNHVTVVTMDKAEKDTIVFGSTVKGMLTPCESVEKQFNRYLISMNLPPGKYKLAYLSGISGIFPVRGSFRAVVFSDFEVGPNKVLYLGRIEATLREKKSDAEPSAGSVFPLLDQKATGFGYGTFDIKISDKFDEDIALFKNKYPVLNQVVLEKAMLGPWKQPSKSEVP